jgi:hypothetical protein
MDNINPWAPRRQAPEDRTGTKFYRDFTLYLLLLLLFDAKLAIALVTYDIARSCFVYFVSVEHIELWQFYLQV